MSKTIKLDECYSISTARDSATLKYACVSDRINEKTGKPIISKDTWYFGSISLALKKYLLESAADNDDVKQILKRIDEVEALINSKF